MFYVLLGKKYRAHLKGFKSIIKFYFWPYPPEAMVRLIEMDGKERVYYDDFCSITEEEGSSKLVCKDGTEKVSKLRLREYMLYRRFYDLKAGEGVPSPLSPLTRWFIGRPIAIYIAYYVPWALSMPYATIFSIYTNVLIIVMMLLITMIVKLMARDTRYIALMSTGNEVIPLPAESGMDPVTFIKALGSRVEIHIPEAVRDIYEEIRKRVKGDVIAAIDILNIFKSKTQEDTISMLLEQGLKFVKIGETWALERARPFKQRIKIPTALAIFLVAFVVGGVVGYVVGSTWGVSPSPPTSYGYPYQYYHYPTRPPIGNYTYPISNTSKGPIVTPAMPPPPPRGGGK